MANAAFLTSQLDLLPLKRDDVTANMRVLMESVQRRKAAVLTAVYEAFDTFEKEVMKKKESELEELEQTAENMQQALTQLSDPSVTPDTLSGLLQNLKGGFEVHFIRGDIADASPKVESLLKQTLKMRPGRVIRRLELAFHINSLMVTATDELVLSTGASADRVPGGLRILTMDGKVLQNINLGQTYSGAACMPDGSVVATCQTRNRIEVWNSGKKTTSFKVAGASSLWECAAFDDGRIAVADFKGQRVTVHNGSGGVLKKLHKDEKDELIFGGPENITSYDNKLIVSDYGGHKVMCFNSNYGLDWTYGSVEGSRRNELCGPRGVTCDNMGRVIIADYGNDRLVILSENGELVGYIKDEIHHPNKVSMMTNGKALVLEREEQMPQIPMQMKVIDLAEELLDAASPVPSPNTSPRNSAAGSVSGQVKPPIDQTQSPSSVAFHEDPTLV